MMLPLALVEWLYATLQRVRPRWLVVDVPETPTAEELADGLLLREVRDGHVKWGHFRCPQCGEHIRIGLAEGSDWQMRVDVFRRPTILPSIWQTGTCGAHFFVRKGQITWCRLLEAGQPS